MLRFVHDLATHIEIKKLRSEGVAMYVYSISVYYARTRNQLNGHGGLFKINTRIEQGSNFVVDNKSRLFFSA